jgi:murein L,D-transpeptidase YafK
MSDANLARHANSEWVPFWKTLKQGYDHFEFARQTPEVAVCQRSYMVNVKLPANMSRIDAEGPCPRFERPVVEAFKPNPNEKFAEERILVPGPKQSRVATAPAAWSTRSGLTQSTP